MDIAIPYYEDHTRVSNSNIGVFLDKGIKAFKKMFDGKDEQTKKSYFETGTMIHMFVLQPEEFWENYIILDFATPKSEQQKIFANLLANTVEFEYDKAVLNAYKQSYSVTNKSEEKMLSEGLDLAEKLKDYLDFLKAENSGKKVISWSDYNMLTTIKENIKAHKKANELLNCSDPNVEQHCEFHINWEFPKKYNDIEMHCKSLIDKININHTTKTITLIDVKTSFDINNFSEHITELDYTRQLAYYWLAIHWYFLNVLKIDPVEYTKETYIIAMQTTKDFDVSVVKFEDYQLNPSLDKICYAINELSWHFKNDKFEFCRDYYEGDGSILYTSPTELKHKVIDEKAV